MRSWFKRLFSTQAREAASLRLRRPWTPPPSHVHRGSAPPLAWAELLHWEQGLPVPEWPKVRAWLAQLPEAEQGPAWEACELAWLEHVRAALGSNYHLTELGSVLLLSSLAPNLAQATVEFVQRSQKRILHVLDGVAQLPAWGKQIVLVFDDDDAYYAYVARYYPEAGAFARSSGMYIHHGCGHFVTAKADLHALEPVIVHEMTHGCLAHLPIPAWLNEGLAVNVEQRLCRSRLSDETPQALYAQHQQFWSPELIQSFWSGQSFLRPDQGHLLSYDLARILVEHLAREGSAFAAFVRQAQRSDAGAQAAAEQLSVDLGAWVSALLDQTPGLPWSPQPQCWLQAPERGGFSGVGA